MSCTSLRSYDDMGGRDADCAPAFEPGDGAVDEQRELGLARCPRSADVEDQPRVHAGLGLNGNPREFLQCVHRLRLGKKAKVALRCRSNGEVHPSIACFDVDVPVEIHDVEQLLDVVGRGVALVVEFVDGPPPLAADSAAPGAATVSSASAAHCSRRNARARRSRSRVDVGR